MSYIINNTNPFVSIKLTQKGRENLSLGQLTFSYWGIGDSELNYNRELLVDANSTDVTLSASSKILRPFDQQPNLKYFITPNDLNPFQVLDDSNKNVIKAIVNNKAEERGFFLDTNGVYTTLIGGVYTPYTQQISNIKLTGGTSLDLTTTTNFNVGDLLLLKVGNTTSGNIVLDESTRPIPNLWYKIQAITPTNVTLDRNLPNYSAQSINSQILIYKGGEVYNTIGLNNTTAYWDSGTLSFQADNNVTCNDVPVWNMNNVWTENPAGITGLTSTNLYEDYTKFGSYQYLGFKNPYSEYATTIPSGDTSVTYANSIGASYIDSVNKAISIIHFTNNSVSNLYGEFLFVDATNNKQVEIFLPSLMYHRRNYRTGSGTTQGMKFIASGTTKLLGSSDITYIDLIEDPSMISPNYTPLVVGRVYPQLKTIVFDNDEIVAAISYKSNRTWTLPELTATLASPSGGTSTGILAPNQTMYLTYSLDNNGSTSGLTTSISCQRYVKITNNTNSPKDIQFRLIGTDLLPYMRKIELPTYDGLGFHAHNFKLVYQIVSDPSIRPDSGLWKTYDFTSTAITGVNGQTINPILLETQNPNILGFNLDILKDNVATTFDITKTLLMSPNTLPQNLQFGDERFFYGNINTYIGATIYKTIFDVRVNSSQFNTTSNPTRSKDLSTNPPNIKISEVGIYDTNKNLVCIGKLSSSVPLVGGNTILLELSMDF